MKIDIFKYLVVGCFVALSGCGSDDAIGDNCQVTIDFDGSSIRYCPGEANSSVALSRVQDEFIWQAMNLYYYWQSEVGTLADDRFGSYNELYEFLNSAGSSEELFEEDLLSPNDRFSWIVDDYIALENSFQGISTSYGYDFGLVRESAGSTNIFGYVRYVIKDGPADLAGLKRGDLFNQVNGVQLTEDNFEEALFESNAYTITLAEIQDEEILATEETVSLVAIELEENPIFQHKVIDDGEVKVGYLVYNQFVNNNAAHIELNDVFGIFQSEGITDLVLDLRYNPGGSVTTTRLLGSMINGAATDSDDLGVIVYNEKLSPFFNSPLRFRQTLPIYDDNNDEVRQEVMNRLTNLSRVFILTTGRSASASELLIVGLDPYMDVTTIGTKTVGKNEGSLTLYDSKSSLFLDRSNDDINRAHIYAIQPIVSKLANSEGFTDYSNGLEPNIEVDERNFLGDLKPLGDLDEPLLAEALAVIKGTARRVQPQMIGEPFEFKSKKHELLEKTLIEPQYVPNITLGN